MMDYILKLKNLADNLAAIGEPVHNRDHILQLLGGLGAEYNSIVASFIAREYEVSLHTAHSILLTYEQRLNFHNSTEDNVISANLTTTSSYHHKTEGIPIEISQETMVEPSTPDVTLMQTETQPLKIALNVNFVESLDILWLDAIIVSI